MAARGAICVSRWKSSTRWQKTSSLTRRQTFDLDTKSTHSQPASCRARPMNVDDDLEDIRWIRGLGGERLPVASYALLPNLKKGIFFAIGEGSRNFVVCFLHTSGQMFQYQTPDLRLLYITSRRVNSVTRGWARAPNERAPFKFHCAAVGFVDRCLSRTRNFAASNETFRWVFVRPILTQHPASSCFFLFFFLLFVYSRADSERYINITAGNTEIQPFYSNISFHWHRTKYYTGYLSKFVLFMATSRLQQHRPKWKWNRTKKKKKENVRWNAGTSGRRLF